MLRNVTDKDAAFLVVGDRTPGDEVTYGIEGRPRWRKTFRHKDGTPYPKALKIRTAAYSFGNPSQPANADSTV